jgi:hypothetical protein
LSLQGFRANPSARQKHAADYATWLPLEDLEEVHEQLRRAISDEEHARIIGVENELDLSVVRLDSTCLKANIHFPADWILLRDMVRTTCKCIATIRRHGLKHRIGDVEEFQRSKNAQCMAMAASHRKPGGKKQTKSVLRRMKRICKTVLEHGKHYRQLLEAQEIFDGLCPRNPRDVEQRFESDEVFVVAQRRRAQSEGRIGILKNAFLDGVPRAKGFKNRSLQVSCAVLAHNLWVIARLKWVQEKKDQLPEAA